MHIYIIPYFLTINYATTFLRKENISSFCSFISCNKCMGVRKWREKSRALQTSEYFSAHSKAFVWNKSLMFLHILMNVDLASE